MAVDTACSSSLVALHLACQSLRNGESDHGAGGGGEPHALARADDGGAARRGCSRRTGGARRSTPRRTASRGPRAAGVLVLKRLSEARAHGDNILAVIRGTAVNQDGASSGLTVPNGLAQQAVIRQALAERGSAARRGELPGGARHGDVAGRPHRGGGDVVGAEGGAPGRGVAVDGLGEDEHRPPGVRGGRGGHHQGGARACSTGSCRRTCT